MDHDQRASPAKRKEDRQGYSTDIRMETIVISNPACERQGLGPSGFASLSTH